MIHNKYFCFTFMIILSLCGSSQSISFKFWSSRLTRKIYLWINTLFNRQSSLSTKVSEDLFVSDRENDDSADIERFCPDQSKSDQMALQEYCENAFENKYFKKQKWKFREDKLPRCVEMNISIDRLSYNAKRFLLGCPTELEGSDAQRHFSVYLASPHTKYKNRSMYFVLLKKSHTDPETEEKVSNIEVSTLLINKNPVHPLISLIGGLLGKKTPDKEEDGEGEGDAKSKELNENNENGKSMKKANKSSAEQGNNGKNKNPKKKTQDQKTKVGEPEKGQGDQKSPTVEPEKGKGDHKSPTRGPEKGKRDKTPPASEPEKGKGEKAPTLPGKSNQKSKSPTPSGRSKPPLKNKDDGKTK